MPLALVRLAPAGVGDDALAGLAAGLAVRGLRVAGAVQINTRPAPDERCDMDLRILPQGRILRISQSLGPGADGCRLDAGALEQAAAAACLGLDHADVLIVNKFGRQEAAGRGFRELIGEAMLRGLPVLTGLGEDGRAAFEVFAGGLATELKPDPDSVLRWIAAVRAASLPQAAVETRLSAPTRR